MDIAIKDFTGCIFMHEHKENIESIRKSEFNLNNDSFKILERI